MTSMPTPARHEFLDDLIQGLTPYEWRYLRNCLMQRDFNCDVLGRLPLELALSVAAYMDPLDIVAMRRVSKRWHSLLTNDEVLKQVAFSRWPEKDRLASECWTRYLDQRLCCEHSLACGRPWSKADYLDSSLCLTSAYMASNQLCGSNFAWCARDESLRLREHMAILSLETGSISRYFPSTRSQLWRHTIALSDILVGCLSKDGHCEIFEIQTGACFSFRLPSTKYQKFVLQDDKVACINGDSLQSFSGVLSLDIITWNLTSKVHRHTGLIISMMSNVMKNAADIKLKWILGYDSIHLIEEGDLTAVWLTEMGISIFKAQNPDKSLDVCRVSEISLQRNEIIASHIIRIDDPRSSRLLVYDSLSSQGHDPVSLPLQEIVTNWCSYVKLASKDCWVYSTDALRRKDSPLYDQYDIVGWPAPCSPFTCWMVTPGDEDNVRFLSLDQDQQTIKPVKPEMPEGETLLDDLRDLSSCADLDHSHASLREWYGGTTRWPLYGNQRFFIVPYCGRIRAYSFDRDFVLANEDMSYRREMEEKAAERKAKKER